METNMNLWKRFWSDEVGVVLSAETVMLGTIGVLGVTTGVGVMTSAMNEELLDMSRAFRSFDQSFQVSGYQVDCPQVDKASGGAASDSGALASKVGSGFQQAPAQAAVETMSLQQVAAPLVNLTVVAQDSEVQEGQSREGQFQNEVPALTGTITDRGKTETELREELRALLEEYSRLQATQSQSPVSP